MLKKIFSSYFAPNLIISTLGIVFIIFSLLILKLKPCPLCLMQQFCLVGIFLISVIGLLFAKKKIFIKSLITLSILISILGIGIAGKQVHLQYFPATVITKAVENTNGCDAVSNQFVLDLSKSLTGSVESCSNKDEEVSGITLAGYSFIFFSFISLLNIVFLRQAFRKK